MKPKYDDVTLSQHKDVWGEVSEEDCTEIANTILDLYEDVHEWNSSDAAAGAGGGSGGDGQPDAKRPRASS